MTYDQLRDIIIERTTALTKCKYQNDISQKKLLEAQALITSLTCERDELRHFHDAAVRKTVLLAAGRRADTSNVRLAV